jgi:type IV pilus biogenesis protein CpaD/CtpE
MPTFIRSFLLFSLLILIPLGCSTTQKIEALKPEADDASPLLYDNATSYINIPVKIKLKDIENQTNKTLTGLIYEDNNIEDDDLEMKIWKQAPITLENANGKIKTVLPLKAFVKYRIGTNKLGIDLYNTKEFNFNGNITLLSDIHLTNWKLSTNTEFKSLDWNESPSVTVLGKAIPITYLINPTIRLFKSKIEKNIDAAIAKSMDFKPSVLNALEKICSPFEMNETYESWLRVVPQELYTTDAKLQATSIAFEMGLKCTMETLVGQKPASQFDRNKIILKPVAKMPEHVTANIVAVSTYEQASKIMTKNFAGQEFGAGSKKVTVQNVSIWHKNDKMIIALDVLGSVNGTIYLTGFPQYSDATKEVYFDQLDYVLDTKSKLIKTANWLAHGYALEKIRQSCRYSIQPNLEEGKASLQKYLKNYSPMPGVFVNGSLKDIQFQRIQLTNKAIIACIKVNGDVSISVDGY